MKLLVEGVIFNNFFLMILKIDPSNLIFITLDYDNDHFNKFQIASLCNRKQIATLYEIHSYSDRFFRIRYSCHDVWYRVGKENGC